MLKSIIARTIMAITFMDHLKEGVIYRKMKHPFSASDVYMYFGAQGYINQAGRPLEQDEIDGKLKRAVTEGKLFKLGAFPLFFFPDIQIPNQTYLFNIIRQMRLSLRKKAL